MPTNIMYFGQLEYGHMIAGISFFKYLKRTYGNEHKMYFVVNDEWSEKLKKQDEDIQTLILKPIENKEESEEEAFEQLASSIMKAKSLKEQESNLLPVVKNFFESSTKYLRLIQPQIDEFFKQIDFHLIVVDSVLPVPFLYNKKSKSGQHIPYVATVTMATTGIGSYDIPPACSLMCSKDRHLFAARNEEIKKYLATYIQLHNKYLEELGVDLRLKDGCFQCASPDLNIYLAPEEISFISNDKRDAIKKPDTVEFEGEWLRIDSTIDNKAPIEQFTLPKEFSSLPGKLIFFSLGSNFSSNTELMQRILNVLGEIDNCKFIVSTGKNGKKLKLPLNCWGDNWLPQKSILNMPELDMMITHGGNNSLTECFHFGVPILALPLFVDQLNNGPRLEETGYGYYVDIFDFDANKLKEGILKVLNDKELKQKMLKASKRIRNNNGIEVVCERLVEMANAIQKSDSKFKSMNSSQVIKNETEV